MQRSVAQNAVYDGYVNFGFGVLVHLGIRVREVTPLGMYGVGHLEPGALGTWGTSPLVQRGVAQNAVYDVYINFCFGVLVHQGMGLAR